VGSRPIFFDPCDHEATVLMPRDSSASALPLHLLGDEMMEGRTLPWGSTPFKTSLERAGRQT
jgi:hypothetical protein